VCSPTFAAGSRRCAADDLVDHVPLATEAHLFLSGNQRSGKTLVHLMLCSHPEITISPGTNVIPWLLYVAPAAPLDAAAIATLRKKIDNDPKLNAWRVDHDAYRARISSYEGRHPHEAASDLMTFFRDQTKPGARYSGNRKGSHCKEGDLLKQCYPECKLVFLMRDGRGAVASMIETQDHDEWSGARMWTLKARRIRELAAQFPRDVLVVRYESLVTDPERTCRDLCTFLRLDFTPAMLTDYRTNDAIRHTTDTTHEETYQPITTTMIDDWRSKLSPEQVGVIEGIGGGELERHGYARSAPKTTDRKTLEKYRAIRARDYAAWSAVRRERRSAK
jgi:hypothetical protein